MARKPLWQEIEEMSPRERVNSVKQHNQNLTRFMTATSESVDKLSVIRKAIKKSEKKIIDALEKRTPFEFGMKSFFDIPSSNLTTFAREGL